MATYSFDTKFDLSNIVMVETDTTDYAGQSLDPADFHIKINVSLATSTGNVIVYAAGSGYDIEPDVSPTNVNPISIPKDASNKPLEGIYSVSLLYYKTISSVDVLQETVTVDYTFINPCVTLVLEATINCADSTIVSTDKTDYGVNATTITRTHTVYAPPVLGLSPFVNALAILIITGIYTKTWTQEIDANVTYTNPDGSQTFIQFQAVREFEVVCDDDMCKIICCLSNLKKTYDKLVCKNPTAAMQMKEDRIDPILLDATFFMLSKNCGNQTKAALYLQQVMDASGCSTDCTQCGGDDTPVFVTPTSSSLANTYVVDSPDNSIAVTSSSVGSTTTFHVQLSAALQDLIDSFTITTVSTSTPQYLTVVESGSGPINYAVNYTGPMSLEPQRVSLLIKLELTGNLIGDEVIATSTVVDASDDTAAGAKFTDPSAITIKLGATAQLLDISTITFTNFLSDPTEKYIVHANLMRYSSVPTKTLATVDKLEVFWFNTGAGQFLLRFVLEADGSPDNWKGVMETLSAEEPVYIAVTII